MLNKLPITDLAVRLSTFTPVATEQGFQISFMEYMSGIAGTTYHRLYNTQQGWLPDLKTTIYPRIHYNNQCCSATRLPDNYTMLVWTDNGSSGLMAIVIDSQNQLISQATLLDIQNNHFLPPLAGVLTNGDSLILNNIDDSLKLKTYYLETAALKPSDVPLPPVPTTSLTPTRTPIPTPTPPTSSAQAIMPWFASYSVAVLNMLQQAPVELALAVSLFFAAKSIYKTFSSQYKHEQETEKHYKQQQYRSELTYYKDNPYANLYFDVLEKQEIGLGTENEFYQAILLLDKEKPEVIIELLSLALLDNQDKADSVLAELPVDLQMVLLCWAEAAYQHAELTPKGRQNLLSITPSKSSCSQSNQQYNTNSITNNSFFKIVKGSFNSVKNHQYGQFFKSSDNSKRASTITNTSKNQEDHFLCLELLKN